jgi:broad specificity phosphatase PhoE
MDTDPAWKPQVCHHTEVPLSPLGQAQAEALGRRLATARIAHLFCSPYLRAVETASAIARHTGLAIRIEPGAMEWQNVDWFPRRPPLQTTAELATQFPMIDASYIARVQPVWPETEAQARERLGRTIKQLVGEFAGSILVIGHGMTVMGMADALLDPPYAGVDDALCGIVRLALRNGKWKLQLNGDTDHLTDLQG